MGFPTDEEITAARLGTGGAPSAPMGAYMPSDEEITQARMQYSSQPQDSDSMLGAAWKGVKGLPGAIASIPGGLYDLGSSVYGGLSGDSQQGEQAIRGIGKTSAGMSGALAGAWIGSFLGPIGTVAGGALGYGLGNLGFDKGMQVAGNDAPTSGRLDRNRFIYDATQGLAGDLAVKGVGAGLNKAGKAIEPYTPYGREQAARRIMQEIVPPTPESVGALSRAAYTADDITQYRTTPEILQDPASAEFLSSLEKGDEFSTRGKARAADRVAARQASMDPISTATEPNKMLAGEDIRAAYLEARPEMGKFVEAKYGEVPLDARVPAEPIQTGIVNSMDKWFGDNSPAINKELTPILNEIMNAPPEGLSVEGIKNLRTRLQNAKANIYERDVVSGNFAADIVNKLDQVESHYAGPALTEAIQARSEMGQTFDQGTPASIGRRGAYGEFQMNASNIPDKVLSSPESAKQFMRALGDKPEAVQAMRDSIIGKYRELSDKRFLIDFKKQKPSLKIILQDDFPILSKIEADILSQGSVEKVATGSSQGQSATRENFAVAAKVDKKFGKPGSPLKGGLIGAGIGAAAAPYLGFSPTQGAAAGGFLGSKFSEAVTAPGLAKIRGSVYEGLAKPAEGARLLSSKPSTYGRGALSSPRASGLSAGAIGVGNGSPWLGSLQGGSMDDAEVKQPMAQLEQPSPITPSGELDPALIDAIIQTESAGNPKAVSPAGAKGLMQLMPAMAKAFGVTDPFDPEENVRGGTELLKEELKRFGGDVRLALAAYNAGSPAVMRAINKAESADFEVIKQYLPKETQNYVPKVMKIYGV